MSSPRVMELEGKYWHIYLASGIPVVSCPINVLMSHYSDVISFAETPEEFLSQCRAAVVEDTPILRKKRMSKVATGTWNSKYEYVQDVIDEYSLQSY